MTALKQSLGQDGRKRARPEVVAKRKSGQSRKAKSPVKRVTGRKRA
jgi:hypothetical protein